MKPTCLSSTAIYLLLAAPYLWLVEAHANVEFPFNIGLVVLCSIFAFYFLVNCYGYLRWKACQAAVLRDEKGAPLKDGSLEAVTGVIQPVDHLLSSPIQKEPCVAYTYTISHPRKSHSSGAGDPSNSPAVVDFNGYGMTASLIQNSRGDVRLLSAGSLEAFPELTIDSQEAARNARAYIDSTQFTDAGPLRSLTSADDLVFHTSGEYKRDWRINPASLPEDAIFEENRLTAGQQVTVLGYYSKEKGGFIAQPHWLPVGSIANRVYPGSGDDALRIIAGNWKLAFLVSLAGSIFTHIFLLLAVFRT